MSFPTMPAILNRIRIIPYIYDLTAVRTYRAIDDILNCVHRDLFAA
jgi:hypothetical protein